MRMMHAVPQTPIGSKIINRYRKRVFNKKVAWKCEIRKRIGRFWAQESALTCLLSIIKKSNKSVIRGEESKVQGKSRSGSKETISISRHSWSRYVTRVRGRSGSPFNTLMETTFSTGASKLKRHSRYPKFKWGQTLKTMRNRWNYPNAMVKKEGALWIDLL